MRHFAFVFSLLLCFPGAAQETKNPILIVTPAGVWQIDFDGDTPLNVPPRPVGFDVIVRGAGGGTPPTPTPNPPPKDDPPATGLAAEVATMSKATLRDADEAAAIAAALDLIIGSGVKTSEHVGMLKTAIAMADGMFSADGRMQSWLTKALAITEDLKILKQGVMSAWSVSQQDTDAVVEFAEEGNLFPDGADKKIELLVQFLSMLLVLIRAFKGGV